MNDTLKIKAGALVGALSIQKEHLANMPHANMPDIKSCNADALKLAEFIRDHINVVYLVNRLETEQ